MQQDLEHNINSGAGTDTLWGGSGNDTFTIASATEGDNDTIDGYGGTDTLQLSTGAHTFATDGNLANIEDIKVHSSGSTLDLTNQTENFNVTVGAGTDTVTGGDGVETFIILNAGEGNDDTFTGGRNRHNSAFFRITYFFH